MPSIASRLSSGVPNGYAPVEADHQMTPSPGPLNGQGPDPNPFARCPLPPVWETNDDSARQFYRAGKIPQYKIWSRSLNN